MDLLDKIRELEKQQDEIKNTVFNLANVLDSVISSIENQDVYNKSVSTYMEKNDEVIGGYKEVLDQVKTMLVHVAHKLPDINPEEEEEHSTVMFND